MFGVETGNVLDWIWMGSLCLWLLSFLVLIVGSVALIVYWRAGRRKRMSKRRMQEWPAPR